MTESRSAAEEDKAVKAKREPTINFVRVNLSEEEYQIDVSRRWLFKGGLSLRLSGKFFPQYYVNGLY